MSLIREEGLSVADESLTATVELLSGADPLLTMELLWQGPVDPQMRVLPGRILRATCLPTGPATLDLRITKTAVEARAWGRGAAEALALVPALAGELDDPRPLVARHSIVSHAQRSQPGLRLTSGTPLYETLLFSILGQKVTSFEARRSFAALVRRFGVPAPGPLGLMLPPPPEKLARTPYWALHGLGIERRRADTLRAAAAVAPRLDALLRGLTSDERIARLTSLPGIGPWTAAEAVRLSFGDADAVSVGDYHLPRIVCAALGGESSGTDERMLELLEPYRGQRARAVLLIERSGLRFERHAPRMAPRSIAGI